MKILLSLLPVLTLLLPSGSLDPASITQPIVVTPSPVTPAVPTWSTGAPPSAVVTSITGNTTIDLRTQGTYDPDRWIVVLDYGELRIEAGAILRFINHPSGAPVVLRASGPVYIQGTIDVSGQSGAGPGERPNYAIPGPGGFRGGRGQRYGDSIQASAGHGPGGGFLGTGGTFGGGGTFASEGGSSGGAGLGAYTYGLATGVPFIGGSGGAGYNYSNGGGGGGAGGGALLIGSDTSIQLAYGARILAYGGNGVGPGAAGSGGSGGLIRLAAPVLSLTANVAIQAVGGGGVQSGGVGRIRIEYNSGSAPDCQPAASLGLLSEFLPPILPRVAITDWYDSVSNSWLPVPPDPQAEILSTTNADVQLPGPGVHRIRIETRGVPVGAPLEIRVTYTRGQAARITTYTAGAISGSSEFVGWTDADLDFSLGVSTVQVRTLL